MLTRNETMDLIKSQLTPYLNDPERQLLELAGFYEERCYESDKPIRFIFRFYDGSAEQGIAYIPLALDVDVETQYAAEVTAMLQQFYFDNDYALNTENDLLSYKNFKIKESISSPSILSNFNDEGVTDYVYGSVEIGLTVFYDAVAISDVSLSLNVDGQGQKPLKGLISYSKSVIRSKESRVLGQGNKMMTERDNAVQVRYNFTYVFKKQNELHKYIDLHAEDIDFDEIDGVFRMGENSKTKMFGIVSYSTQTAIADVVKVDLTLCYSGEW